MTFALSVTACRAVLIAAFSISVLAQTQTSNAQTVSEQDAYEMAREAYIHA